MSADMIIDLLQAALRWGAPLILVSIGEVYAERTGVINMGIEGIMLVGALSGVAISFFNRQCSHCGNFHNDPWSHTRVSLCLLDRNPKDESGSYWPDD